MKDIKAIIEEHASELSDEAKAAILKDVRANYKTVAEYVKKTDRISELESQVQSIGEKAEKLEGDAKEIEELREQLAAAKKAEADRKAEAEREEKLSNFRKSFDDALNGREFANSIVAETVFQKAYEACNADAAKGADAAIAELTKDMEGVWVNPQRDPRMMPTFEQVSSAKASDVDTAKKSFASMLFGGSAQ